MWRGYPEPAAADKAKVPGGYFAADVVFRKWIVSSILMSMNVMGPRYGIRLRFPDNYVLKGWCI